MKNVSPILLAALLTACSSSPEPEGLVSGSVVIDERDMPADSFYFTALGAHDLLAEGDRLWLVHYRFEAGGLVEHSDPGCPACSAEGGRTPGTMTNYLATSEDGGTTWTTRPVSWPWAFVSGLFRSGERLFVEGSSSQQGAGGNLYEFWQVRELDPTTSEIRENAGLTDLMLGMPLQAHELALSGAYASFQAGSTTMTFTRDSFDPGSNRVDHQTRSVAPPPCAPARSRMASASGLAFTGYCSASTPPRACRIDFFTNQEVTASCRPVLDYPMEFMRSAGSHSLDTSRGPVWVSDTVSDYSGGHVVAQGPLAETEDVLAWRLPGKVATGFGATAVHPAGAGLLRLEDGRFVELGDAGAYTLLEFPASPCNEPSACPRSYLHWLHPLGDGRFLTIYSTDTAGHHQRLVALPQEPKRTHVPAPNPPVLNVSGATAPPPVDRFCLLAHSCFSISYGQCTSFVGGGLVDRMDTTKLAAARTCEEARAAWPGLVKAGASCTAPAYGGFVCADKQRAYCSGLVQYAWDECANGTNTLTCDASKACYPSQQQIDACYYETRTSLTCEGDVAVYPCSTGRLQHDCGFLGYPCSTTSTGGCDVRTVTPSAECRDFGFQCSGSGIAYCMNNVYRYQDCKDFGMTRCVSSSNLEAHCE